MNDPGVVGGGHGVGHGEHVPNELALGLGRNGLPRRPGERATAHQPHRVERAPVGHAPHVVHGHDPRVVEPARDRRFPREPRRRPRVVGPLRPQLLERHVATQRRVACGMNHAHPAATEERADQVPIERGGGR